MGIVRTSRNGTTMEFDATEKISSFRYPKRTDANFFLDTEDDVTAHFDDIMAFWREVAAARPIYWLINYENFSVSQAANRLYALRLKEIVDKASLGIIRYNASSLHQALVRTTNIKWHNPSHLYGSLDEAMAVIRYLKAGPVAKK